MTVRRHDNVSCAQSIGPESRQGNNTVLDAEAAECIGGYSEMKRSKWWRRVLKEPCPFRNSFISLNTHPPLPPLHALVTSFSSVVHCCCFNLPSLFSSGLATVKKSFIIYLHPLQPKSWHHLHSFYTLPNPTFLSRSSITTRVVRGLRILLHLHLTIDRPSSLSCHV